MIRRALLAASTLLLALPSAAELPAASADGSTDGWHSWRVAAVDDAPSWCCGQWNRGVATGTSCKLDSRSNHIDDDGRFQGSPVEMQIYVRLANDTAVDVRAYDARCPVEGAIVDHGNVDPDASIRWLERHATSDARPQTMMAIAVHDGPEASEALKRYAAPGEALKTRKEALFWIGQLRGQDAGDVLFETVRRDEEPAIIDQAVFAISRLPGPRSTQGLLDLVEDRDLSREVRERALFWLAQSDSADAWAYIDRLLTQ